MSCHTVPQPVLDVDHVLTDGLVDMLPLHCPVLPKADLGGLHPVLRDPFVLLLELLRQTCGPSAERDTYASDLRTLLLVRCLCVAASWQLLSCCVCTLLSNTQALIHAVYVPAVCRAVVAAWMLHSCRSTLPPAAILAHALDAATPTHACMADSAVPAATPQVPDPSCVVESKMGPNKRARQFSPEEGVDQSSSAVHNASLDEDIARLLLPLLRRAAVLLALVLDTQPPATTLHTAPALPELHHWQALLRLPSWQPVVRRVLAMPSATIWLNRWVGCLDHSGTIKGSSASPDGMLSVLRALPKGPATERVHVQQGDLLPDMLGQENATQERTHPAAGLSGLRVPYPPAPRLLPLPRVCQVGASLCR